jgi:hypothetical protein
MPQHAGHREVARYDLDLASLLQSPRSRARNYQPLSGAAAMRRKHRHLEPETSMAPVSSRQGGAGRYCFMVPIKPSHFVELKVCE